MNATSDGFRRGRSANASELRQVFVARAHQLLQLGYERLGAANLSDADEPSITGLLVSAIEEVFDDPPAEITSWCDHFHISDDPPENTGERRGKRRRRVDLRISSSARLPRARFCFEAKRLFRGNNSISAYIGDNGLGCFLNGDYAPNDSDAGMVGYVQRGCVEEWVRRISEGMLLNANKCCLSEGDGWRECRFEGGPAFTFSSIHNRRTNGSLVVVFHSLFDFSVSSTVRSV